MTLLLPPNEVKFKKSETISSIKECIYDKTRQSHALLKIKNERERKPP
jgi:hypothetical protein